MLEARYLTIFADADAFKLIGLKPAYEALITALSDEGALQDAEFYKLEWQLFVPLLEPQSITNRRVFQERLAYLGRQQQRSDLVELGKALFALGLTPTGYADEEFAELGKALNALHAAGEHLLYQHLVILIAETLLVRQNYERCADMLSELESYQVKGAADIPKKLRERLSAGDNWITATLTAFTLKLPERLLEKRQGIGSFLLDGSGD